MLLSKEAKRRRAKFDLCVFYMAQIGEAAKMLTDDRPNSLICMDFGILKSFRNMIDHTYEK